MVLGRSGDDGKVAGRVGVSKPGWDPMAELQILGKKPLAWLRRTVRNGGVVHAVRVGWFSLLDTWYDYRHGTDTISRIHPSRVQTNSENKQRSSGYGATRALPFFGLLKRLQLPKDQTFVDLGAGKGRVMFLAAQWGFKRIVGIEFSKPLCEIALNNLQVLRLRRLLQADADLRIVESDVTQYEFGPTDSILFLFDPFDAVIMNRVLENLGSSIRRHPRPVWLIYNTPAEHSTVMASGVFEHTEKLLVRGTEFQIYRHLGPQR